MGFDVIERLCSSGRAAVIEEIERIVTRYAGGHDDLTQLMLDYPLRSAKALRPTLCLATTRALGGNEEAALTTAAVLELLHNAFLIHDDIEDESLYRRGEPTLQRARGLPIAVNVGDGMFALSLSALLENTELLGLRQALEILELVAATMRTTVLGQATELGWIRDNLCRFADGDVRAPYERMVLQKTATYSFVAPVRVGCIGGDAPAEVADALERFARHVGIAFQIADDLLNLRDDVDAYGKEAAGDLWEGKRTLMLLHALAEERDVERLQRADEILRKSRPTDEEGERWTTLLCAIEETAAGGHLDEVGRAQLLASVRRVHHQARAATKSIDDVRYLGELIRRHDGVAFAASVAAEHAERARAALHECAAALAPGDASQFLEALPEYVVSRLR
jgi:geranylgeranyl diphosphate synthase, type II